MTFPSVFCSDLKSPIPISTTKFIDAGVPLYARTRLRYSHLPASLGVIISLASLLDVHFSDEFRHLRPVLLFLDWILNNINPVFATIS